MLRALGTAWSAMALTWHMMCMHCHCAWLYTVRSQISCTSSDLRHAHGAAANPYTLPSAAAGCIPAFQPYEYDALEPSIDEATMRVHHLGHHQGYTNKINAVRAASLAPSSGYSGPCYRWPEQPLPTLAHTLHCTRVPPGYAKAGGGGQGLGWPGPGCCADSAGQGAWYVPATEASHRTGVACALPSTYAQCLPHHRGPARPYPQLWRRLREPRCFLEDDGPWQRRRA